MHDSAPAIGRRLTWVWLGWVVFVIYGSLLPLEFHAVPWDTAVNSFMHMPWLNLGLASRIDWLANALIYFPLGYLATCAAMAGTTSPGEQTRGVPPWAAALLFFCLGSALAWTVEFAQIFFPQRTVSLNDVLAECAGTAIGCVAGLLFGRPFVQLLARAMFAEAPPLVSLFWLYFLSYATLSLFPFDFSTASAVFDQKLATGHAGWWLAPIHLGDSLRAGLQFFGEALLAIPFGIALGRGPRSSRWPAAWFLGLGFGVLIEVIQLFLLSTTSQGASALSRAFGFSAGAAISASTRSLNLTLKSGTKGLLLMSCAAVWALVLGYLAGWGRTPVSISGWWERAASLNYLPFYYHYYVGESRALTSLLQCLASYACVGVATGLLWARPRPVLSAGLAALIAFGLEGSKLILIGRHPDPTNVLIAAAAAWAAHRIVHRLRRQAPAASLSLPQMTNKAPELAADQQAIALDTAVTAGNEQLAAMLATAVILVASYAAPGNHASTALALTAYVACVWCYPQTVLFLVPMSIGLTDVASYTGPRWLDTLDLAMLATAILAFVHPSTRNPGIQESRRGLPMATWLLLGLVPGVLIGLSHLETIDPIALLTPLDLAWGAMQSKGLMWAFVLTVFVQRSGISADRSGLMLGRGMVIALAGVVVLTVTERLAFVGPLDFSSDYRAPGPFSAIALGGAFIECFLAAATPFAVVAAMRERRRWVRWSCAVLVMGAAYATMITFSRGGQVVFLLMVCATVALLAMRRFNGRHLGQLRQDHWKSVLLVAPVGVIAGVILLAPYAMSRFDTLGRDATGRLTHWKEGLAFGSSNTFATLFGNGMGSFGRQAYVLGDPKERPGMFELIHAQGHHWLRSRPGSLSYLDQRVDVIPSEPLTVTARLRASQYSGIQVLLCEKDLVQSRTCGAARLTVPADGQWHTVSEPITLPFNPLAGWPARPLRLTLFSGGAGAIEVDDLSMIDAQGQQRLRNGDFEDGPAHWMYSSDRHLTWHMKNLWLQVFFELGIVGVIAHAGLLVAGLWGARRAAGTQPYFLAAAMALLAFQGVGLIDSVIDSPRFLQLYLSLALLGALLGRRKIRHRRQRQHPAPRRAERSHA